MLYALIGTGLLGALSTALLLWRKSVVETELADTKGRLTLAQNAATSATVEISMRAKAYAEQLVSLNNQISTIRTERDQAIDELAKTGAPGSLTNLLRNQVGAKPSNS